MKRISLSLVMVFSILFAFSQPLTANFENDTVTIERDKVNDLTVNIPVNINGLNPPAGSANSINYAVNPAPATTMLPGSFSLNVSSVTIVAGTLQVKCPITVIHGSNAGGAALYISVQLSYNNPAAQTSIVVLKVAEKKKEEKSEEDKTGDLSDRNRIMLLNAYNFDFGSTSLKSNYVGHLNFFAPHLGKNSRWGFNSGIMKINYGQKDSTGTGFASAPENVLLSPFDTIKAGLKYLREINSYKTEKSNVVWSFYVQPTFEIIRKSKTKNQRIYFHLHMELLASKWTSTTTIVNLKRDTSILPQNFSTAVFRNNLNSTNTYSVNSLSGYFGAGVTFDLIPWKDGGFFFQPTIGLTSNAPSLSSVDIATGLSTNSFNKENPRTWRSFYLVRANYRHLLSKDATVNIGMDIRGLLPLYNPQYAAFVGLNLGLDSILGLIGGDKKDKK